MIRVNLTKRIWLSFISLIAVVGLLIVIIYPISIKGTLTEETYRIIEQEQIRVTNPIGEYLPQPESELDFIERREAERSVGHLFILNQYGKLQGDPVPNDVLQEMGENAYNQDEERGRYELTYQSATLFYVVSKIETIQGEAYQISYMWDTYRDEMVNKLWSRLLFILFFAILVSSLPALWLKRYLRQPFIILGNQFEQIAKRNWQEPFQWKGDEEFEKLSNQFEAMRQNLIRYDHAQKTFIQHASHELKTPIMVVKSYAHSVKDGVLPHENLEQTMDVIIEESNRMEKRVKDMLYYTKLDSLKDEKTLIKEKFAFGSIAYLIEERFRVQREDVSFLIEGAGISIAGDPEQIQVLMENLVENALRYARNKIIIQATDEVESVVISVENNGQQIPQQEIEHIFNPFYKGNKGQFGLGLAIVKRIAELHGGSPSVKNVDDGVRFMVSLPKQQIDMKSN